MGEVCAIVGCGLIGRAWAIDFARAGWQVRLFDPVEGAVPAALAAIDGLLADLVENGLLDAEAKAATRARLEPASSLEAALAGAAWVQESAPEKLELKRELWCELDRLATAEAVLASSTSAILPSRFTEDLAGRARCLVVHPLNPPYLVPAVELCPAPWTSMDTLLRAETVMRGLGHSVIRLAREIDGFVMNRLQAALVEEAFKLVAAGICTAEEVDIGLRDGLALRWCFAGPFEVGDLNAPGGIRDYVTRYRSVFDSVLASALPRPDWTGPVLDEIEASRRLRLLAAEIAHRQRWRDRRLMALLAHKRQASATIGD
ncbi:MAG: 3-hydroxyacyl-CoA dehydrogenase [Geminicoccaceae bacterium]|nr:MAG: 3-hydroxyacyl-CoA dehydrogenase [Geminicoccaceae bacterium]